MPVRFRILFIDDDPSVLRSLGDYFARLGHEVHRAPTGREGIAVWDRLKPDVTVLDLFMPEMNGVEVLEVLRHRGATVIMLTAYGEIESAVEAMRLGAENFLIKPVDMPHLVAAVERAAEKTHLRVENRELRNKLSPNLRRRVLRAGLLAGLIAGSVGLGSYIGGEQAVDTRPRVPIPVPVDSLTQGELPGSTSLIP